MKYDRYRHMLDEALHSRRLTEPQKRALGARLIYHRMRQHFANRKVRKSIAIACIRLQTYYGTA